MNNNQKKNNPLAQDYLSLTLSNSNNNNNNNNSNSNQDFFNTSLSEKKVIPSRDWLNNSINLNSSINLPPELR